LTKKPLEVQGIEGMKAFVGIFVVRQILRVCQLTPAVYLAQSNRSRGRIEFVSVFGLAKIPSFLTCDSTLFISPILLTPGEWRLKLHEALETGEGAAVTADCSRIGDLL